MTPPSVYDYDLETREHTLLKRLEVPGGYDPSQYAVERLQVPAPDGVEVPVTLVRRRDVVADGTAPAFLLGYGSYGFPYPVRFDRSRVSLLDRGAVVALAHIRGGGELGKPWHDAGKMAEKMNTFTDFIAVGDALVERGWCARERLVIGGGSAGGMLIGAVVNMRPDLAKAAVLWVPFVDVLNTMEDASLPLTVGEWEEWGNPLTEEQYRWIRAYCPYTNLAAQDYPAMLVKTSFNDSQVMYWEPAKYVAKLRTLKTDGNPLLLYTNLDAGHGGASGRYDHLREDAFDYAFVLWQMGLAEGG
ncbi:MAG: prolyl oligopeptidase family serine peptidase [Dehalococcoidia bacterium]|nr:prolyl oligopeptidase family serine peptidase [Dehalococcoidia bacterium]